MLMYIYRGMPVRFKAEDICSHTHYTYTIKMGRAHRISLKLDQVVFTDRAFAPSPPPPFPPGGFSTLLFKTTTALKRWSACWTLTFRSKSKPSRSRCVQSFYVTIKYLVTQRLRCL